MRRLALLVLLAIAFGTVPASAGDRPVPQRRAERSPAVLTLLKGALLDLLSLRALPQGLGAEMDPFGRTSTTTAPGGAPPPSNSTVPVDPDQLGAEMDPFG